MDRTCPGRIGCRSLDVLHVTLAKKLNAKEFFYFRRTAEITGGYTWTGRQTMNQRRDDKEVAKNGAHKPRKSDIGLRNIPIDINPMVPYTS